MIYIIHFIDGSRLDLKFDNDKHCLRWIAENFNPNRIESIYNWSQEYWLPVEKLTKYR